MTFATIDQHIGEFLCHSNGQVCLSSEGGTEISTFVSSEGYEFFSHKAKTYSVAEVICTAFHGPRPFDTQCNKPMQVDHIDRVKLNNSASNLRWVPKGLQMRNRRLFRNNKTGLRGVREKSHQKFIAELRYNKKLYHLGTFSSKIDAAQIYIDTLEQLCSESADNAKKELEVYIHTHGRQ